MAQTKRYTCAGCDTEANGTTDDLPEGWYRETTPMLGDIERCPQCAVQNASRIATQNMSTDQIMAAGDDADEVTRAAQNRIKSFIQRILRLREDAREITADLKEVSLEAKGEGFDWSIMMRVARESEKDPQKRQEADALFDTYAKAFGLEV